MSQRSRTRSRAGLSLESTKAWSTGRKSASDFAPLPSSERRLKPSRPATGGGVEAAAAAARALGCAPAVPGVQATASGQVCGG